MKDLFHVQKYIMISFFKIDQIQKIFKQTLMGQNKANTRQRKIRKLYKQIKDGKMLLVPRDKTM